MRGQTNQSKEIFRLFQYQKLDVKGKSHNCLMDSRTAIKQLQEEREEEERRQQEAEKQRLERERKEKEQQRQDADAESRKLEIERQAEERANRKRRQHPTTVLQESLSTEASTPVHRRPKSPAPNRRLPPLMTPKMMTNKSYDTAQMHSNQ
eukprot:265683_1